MFSDLTFTLCQIIKEWIDNSKEDIFQSRNHSKHRGYQCAMSPARLPYSSIVTLWLVISTQPAHDPLARSVRMINHPPPSVCSGWLVSGIAQEETRKQTESQDTIFVPTTSDCSEAFDKQKNQIWCYFPECVFSLKWRRNKHIIIQIQSGIRQKERVK